MIARAGPGWQIVLADLALILFVSALTALGMTEEAEDLEDPTHTPASKVDDERAGEIAQFAPAQALFRASPGGPDIGQWLDLQSPDPRSTLTIFANHAPGEAVRAWKIAREWAEMAEARGISVRVVLSAGQRTEIHASLGFDAAPAIDAP